MKCIAAMILFFIGLGSLKSQVRFNNTYTYDNITDASIYQIEEDTLNHRYVSTLTYAVNNEFLKSGIQSFDLNGNFQILNPSVEGFSYSYGPDTECFIQTQDGGFVFAGGWDGPDIIKWNSDLEIEWQILGENGVYEAYAAVIELPNGELLALHQYGNRPSGESFFDIERYTSSGELIQIFPYDQQGDQAYWPESFLVKGEYLYFGMSRYFLDLDLEEYNFYAQLSKINWQDGEVLWTEIFENGTDTTCLAGMQMEFTGENELKWTFSKIDSLYSDFEGANISDQSWSAIYVCTLDPETGDTSNVKRITDSYLYNGVRDIEYTSDGGVILLLSYTDLIVYGTHNFLIKLNSDDEIEWSQDYYPDGITSYGNSTMELRDVEPTEDGGYLMAGKALDYLTLAEGIPGKPWIVKTDACGQIMANDCTFNGLQEKISQPIAIYPNPAVDFVHLIGKSYITKTIIYSQDGRLIREQNFTPDQEIILDVSDLPRGLYIISTVDTNYKVVTQKLIVTNDW